MAHAVSTILPAARRAAGALSIKARVIGGIVLLLAVFIGVLAMSILLSQHEQDSVAELDYSERIHDAYHEAEHETTLVNLLLTSFVITGSDQLSQEIRASVATVEEKLTEARSLERLRGEQDITHVNDEAELAELDEMLAAASAISDGTEQLTTLRASGDVTGARQALDAVSDDLLSLGSSIGEAAELEARELTDYRSRDASARNLTLRLQIVTALVGTAVAIIMATVFSRSILKPLNTLRKTARAIASGDLTARVPQTGPREFADLGSDLDVMKDELLSLTKKQELVDALRESEDAAQHMAQHDALTGLPNRALFQDRLSRALDQAGRTKEKVAVMFLDIDRFKLVNDSAGHAQGDELLKDAGARLARQIREGDSVARIGGDEFAILLPSIARIDDAADLAQRILEDFRRPWALGGRDMIATASIGVCLYPDDGEDTETLLQNAETAMYRAKEQGNQFQLYAPGMNATIMERVALENDLRSGLEREEFVLYYQPQTNIRSGQVVGAEALVRWQHPWRGLVLPGDFISVAEGSDLIWSLDEWVLRTACVQNKTWQNAGLPSVTVAVNLSARHIQTQGLATWVAQALADSGLDPRHLELEITETAAMADAERSVAVLTELRALGVQIAVDDFGTGYSSLSYLKRLPITTVKIDRSFVSDLDVDDHSRTIVSAIITLAHSLGFDVTAEGVETKEQLALLKEYGCDTYQGFLFSKPWPAAAFEEIFRNQRPASRPVTSSLEPAGSPEGTSALISDGLGAKPLTEIAGTPKEEGI